MKRLALAVLLATRALAAQEFAVTPAELAPSQHASAPLIATSDDRYLIVWFDRELSGTLGTRLDAAGNALDFPPLLISKAGIAAAIVGTGNGDFLILQRIEHPTVKAIRVKRDGSIIDGGEVKVDSPALAWSGTHVLAAEYRDATLLDRDGNTLVGPIAMPRLGDPLAVASNGNGFLIIGTYLPNYSAGSDVEIFPVYESGFVGPPVSIAPPADAPAVALASDGSRYLVVTAGATLRTQIVTGDGTLSTPAQTTRLPWAASDVRATWDGTNYVVVWTSRYQASPNVVRVTRDGVLLDAPKPLPVRASDRPVGIELASMNGQVMVATDNGSIGRIALDEGSIASGPLPARVPVGLTARMQWQPSIAPFPGGAIVACAEETDDPTLTTVRIATVDTIGRPTGKSATMIDLPRSVDIASTHIAFDGKTVVVTCNTIGTLYLQRFTPNLDPIDATAFPVAVRSIGDSLASADGVSLISWSDITCCALHSAGAALIRGGDDPIPLDLPRPAGAPIGTAAAWNGSEFLVLWNENVQTETLAFVRIARDGTLLDPTVRRIPNVATNTLDVQLASNGDDFFALWSTKDSALAGMRIAADGTYGTAAPILQSTALYPTPLLAPLHSAYITGALQRFDSTTAVETLQWRFGGATKSLLFAPAVNDYYHLRAGGGLAQAGNNLLATYSRLDPASGFTWRVFVQAIEAQRPYGARH